MWNHAAPANWSGGMGKPASALSVPSALAIVGGRLKFECSQACLTAELGTQWKTHCLNRLMQWGESTRSSLGLYPVLAQKLLPLGFLCSQICFGLGVEGWISNWLNTENSGAYEILLI